ncbi:hypothetical protein LZ554_001174 [Drepanopeziza brunnea f. sp. 'monogermtubi']|nr:hypothetical protein LZ554_001174 [Drepanopeziza brunnea f. sp. 'monogermtubi']
MILASTKREIGKSVVLKYGMKRAPKSLCRTMMASFMNGLRALISLPHLMTNKGVATSINETNPRTVLAHEDDSKAKTISIFTPLPELATGEHHIAGPGPNAASVWALTNTPSSLADTQRVYAHCSEAWRNGLLYIFRVFKWELGNSVPTHIVYRARAIVEHVISYRDVNMMSRQALLPLFLAGCELRDRSIQKQIVKLCSIWDERTRYHMFRNAVHLLEEVCAEQGAKGFDKVW